MYHLFMENDMRNAPKNSGTENMYALLECLFVDYANQLRAAYPGRTIRNAAVFATGVPEFARRGFIRLVDVRSGIPKGVPDFIVRRIKRAKYQPIWVPGVNFPDNPLDICERMKPSMRGSEVVWRHIPSKRRSPRRKGKP
jgi:hypothetical protein